MHIWLINPYGPIPGEGWRDYRFTILGETLAERGHQVIWWTANYSHHFKHFRSTSWEKRPIKPGFEICLVPTTGYSSNVSLGRLIFELNFARLMFKQILISTPPNLIVATDPPQIIGYTAVRLSKKLQVPLILDIFDLWPELFTIIFPKKLRSLASRLFLPFYAIRRHNLRNADAITALCDTYLGMAKREIVPAQRDPKPTLTVFNGTDVGAIQTMDRVLNEHDTTLSAYIGNKKNEDIWVIYAGTLGNNYDIASLLKAALYLRNSTPNLKIWIAGEGPLRPFVSNFIKTHRLSNLTYIGTLTPRQLVTMYRACDIGLCPYAPGSNVAMPDKAYDYMAAGLPIVNSLNGELESLLRDQQIGIQYQAGDAKALAIAIESLALDPERRQAMARNSFSTAMQFDRYVQYPRFVDFIEKLNTQTFPRV